MTTQKGFAHTFLIIGLLAALVGALGFVFWQNFIYEEQVVTKTASPTATKNEQEPVLSDQELAQNAAQDFVDAQILDAKYIATPPEIKGIFASSGVAPSSQPSHIVSRLLLKKVNENWIVIHHGQNGPDRDTITRFAIPEDFQN